MLRPSSMLALASLCIAGSSLAQEPNLCKSLCDSERTTCKRKVENHAADDADRPEQRPNRNELARTAQRTQALAAGARAGEHAGVQSRRMRYAAACEDSHARCTRGCAVPAAQADSPVITRRPGQ